MAGNELVKVAVLDDYQGVALEMADWSELDGRAEVTVFRDHLADQEAVVARLEPFQVVCVMRERTPLTGAMLARLPNLRLIVTTGPRNASIDMAAAKNRGIPVCNTGVRSQATAELAWALILGLVRNIPAENASLRAGGWQTSVGGDLHGATLGVVGLGRIGSIVARVGLAFGMNVVAWSQNLTEERAAEHGVRLVSKEELFRQADIVTIHLVLSDRTRGLVGERELQWMKPTAFLVNSSRGPIVDEGALISALRKGTIAGAALDVYDIEPLPESHPFRSLDNLLATPHVGFVSRKVYELFYRDTVEDVVAWLDGKPIRVLNA